MRDILGSNFCLLNMRRWADHEYAGSPAGDKRYKQFPATRASLQVLMNGALGHRNVIIKPCFATHRVKISIDPLDFLNPNNIQFTVNGRQKIPPQFNVWANFATLKISCSFTNAIV